MVSLFKILVCGFIGVFFLPYANRTVANARLFRSIFWGESYDSQEIVDGEPAAIEGNVIVDESAYVAERTVENTDTVVGAYLWRATFSNNKNVMDFKNRTVRDGRITFASGIEFGQFSVAGSNRAVRVDPTWLLDIHDSTQLSELTVSGIHSHLMISIPLWESPSVHLTGAKTKRTLDQISDLINTRDGEGLDRYHIESKPVREGNTIAVCGNIRIEQGVPVIYGTDTLPLAISDQGFDGLRKNLRRKIGKHGLVSISLLAIIVYIWYNLH